MNGKLRKVVLLLILMGISIVSQAGAAIQQVPQGGSVYIGERGLDISGWLPLANTKIGWWSPGAAYPTAAPTDRFTVTNPQNLAITPQDFASRTGSWYCLTADDRPIGVAFYVKDPMIAMRIEDVTVNVDITENRWVYRGDEVRFRIDSNLADMTGRGVPGAPVTIRVQGPDGGIYGALTDKAGTINPLDVKVNTNYFYTGAIWDTRNSAYIPGTYTIWAECNANGMKDNYDVEGKTRSQPLTLLVQEQNPLIRATTPTTIPTEIMTIPTTKRTTIVTTMPTTPSPTTPSPSATTVQQTVQPPVTTTPSPTPTKAAGLCGICAILAVIFGCVVSYMRNH